jgi:hypothetical protein
MRLGRRALGAAVLVIAAACTPPTPPEEPTLAETLGLPSDTPLLDVACAPVAGVCTSSIQAQVDAVPAGTTAIVRVAAGQYRESVRISAKSVHLVGAGAASTIIDGTGLTPVAGSTRFGVVVAQAPNSSVRRLTVRNFSAMDHDHFRSALRAESTAGVVFEDVTVADNSYAGIGLSEASGARLTRVTAAGNDAIGIAAYRANGLVLTDSLVAGNTDTLRYQDEQEQYRESAGFKTTESHNVLVTKSTFRDNGSTGVWTDVGTSDSVISFNTVVNNKWHGIETEITSRSRTTPCCITPMAPPRSPTAATAFSCSTRRTSASRTTSSGIGVASPTSGGPRRCGWRRPSSARCILRSANRRPTRSVW